MSTQIPGHRVGLLYDVLRYTDPNYLSWMVGADEGQDSGSPCDVLDRTHETRDALARAIADAVPVDEDCPKCIEIALDAVLGKVGDDG